MKANTKPDERRAALRTVKLLSGVATSIDGSEREACVVGNLSNSGALLMVERSDKVPDDLVLIIDGEKVRRPAHVVWRRPNTVAVSFITRQTDGASKDWVFPPE